jgi:WD40 repeat protein
MPVAFFPDGSRVLVRTERGVQIYNLQAQKEESFIELPAERNLVTLALSPNGQKLAWALDDNTIQLLPTSGKGASYTLSGHTGMINKLRFSPDGTRLYSASQDTWIRAWDMTGSEVGAFQPTGAGDFPADIQGIGISPDGTVLATIPFDGPVKLWDTQSFQLVQTLGATGGFITSDVVFSPDGAFVAADSATGLFLWKTAGGAQLMGGNPGINSMAVEFSPDGQVLAYGEITETNRVVLSSPDGSKIIRTLEGSPLSPVGELLFSPDSSLLLAMDWVEVRVWRVEDGSLLSVGKTACP